ncbi:MAG: FAD-dependent oxidoreductase, partial [Bacilli bacterium]|nr:FAD-dependent oxidoreductase [Bacilli bacterium]
GTEKAYEIYAKLESHLKELGVEMLFRTPVIDLIIENNKIIGVKTNQKDFYAPKIVIGVGRDGSDWLNTMCDKYNIDKEVGTIDIGVRIECDSSITKTIDDIAYESKLIYFTNTFDDKVRTFCWNPRGEVTEERYDNNLALANGHSYNDEKLKTNKTNLALLVSLNFTEPFKTPIEYGKHIASLANMLSGNKVLVQRYGDFKRGRRTTHERLLRNNTKPTLKDAVPGDLSLVLPYRIMLDITETIEALDNIIEGFASDGTLLYGVEVKFYSNIVKVSNNFETNIKNLHVLGDGAGITRGLIQASMNGVAFARDLTLD